LGSRESASEYVVGVKLRISKISSFILLTLS